MNVHPTKNVSIGIDPYLFLHFSALFLDVPKNGCCLKAGIPFNLSVNAMTPSRAQRIFEAQWNCRGQELNTPNLDKSVEQLATQHDPNMS